MDCLEGQCRLAGNFESLKFVEENIKDASLHLRTIVLLHYYYTIITSLHHS